MLHQLLPLYTYQLLPLYTIPATVTMLHQLLPLYTYQLLPLYTISDTVTMLHQLVPLYTASVTATIYYISYCHYVHQLLPPYTVSDTVTTLHRLLPLYTVSVTVTMLHQLLPPYTVSVTVTMLHLLLPLYTASVTAIIYCISYCHYAASVTATIYCISYCHYILYQLLSMCTVWISVTNVRYRLNCMQKLLKSCLLSLPVCTIPQELYMENFTITALKIVLLKPLAIVILDIWRCPSKKIIKKISQYRQYIGSIYSKCFSQKHKFSHKNLGKINSLYCTHKNCPNQDKTKIIS